MASTTQHTPVTIASLRGGMNDTDPSFNLPADQCVLANNVEFWLSACGERRNGFGVAAIDYTNGSNISGLSVVHIGSWHPTNDPSSQALLFIGIDNVTFLSTGAVARDINGVFSNVTQLDAIDLNNSSSNKYPNTGSTTPFPDIYSFRSQELNGKLFLSYHNTSNTDRLHVWDGTSWRRTGLAAPAAAPTAANSGAAGALAGTRYYRVRYTVQVSSVVVRRGEPSAVLTFTPDGAHASITITKPATITEGETHWELEASTDNANFYVLASTLVGTTTVVDTTVFSVNCYAPGVNSAVSEVIGTYLTQPSCKFISIEGDRLIMAGHWSDTSRASQIAWSPVKNDPGVGNDERLPINSLYNNRISLDNYTGGEITGVSRGVNGSFYVFKWSAIYKFTRTGYFTSAYSVITVSSKVGALPGSVVDGIDENGGPCVFFLDPKVGGGRIGSNGLEMMLGLRKTWKRVNTAALFISARGMYYAEKQQVHWWVPVDGGSFPGLKLISQVNNIRPVTGGVSGCWSTANGGIATAYCVCSVLEYNANTNAERPYLGFDYNSNAGLPAGFTVGRADVGQDDSGVAYVATITTKPYDIDNSLNDTWGAIRGLIAVTAQALRSIAVSLVRDFGIETSVPRAQVLAPVASETIVVKDIDDLFMSEARVIQATLTD